MKPEDLYRIVFVDDAQISHDARLVAYVRTQLNADSDDYRSQIWVAPAEGGEPAQFTRGDTRDQQPRWSPNGLWLAFLSNRGADASEQAEKKKGQIWLIATTGGEARRLTNRKQGVESFVWSPDSTRIAFMSRVATKEEEADDSDDTRPQTPGARIITGLKYKLNGEGFTYDRRPHVFVIGIEGSDPTQLTDGEYYDRSPAWSPDGSHIAFTSARHAGWESDSVTDIYVVPSDGGEARRITPGRGPSHDAAFSPGGDRIAYYGHTDPVANLARNALLWTIPAEGGEPQALTASLDRSVEGQAPVWTNDGGTIFFGAGDRGALGVRSVPASGGEDATIVGGKRIVSSWSVATNGSRLAFTASEATSPGDVHVVDSSGIGERRLTNVNARWLEEVELSAPEEFTFQSVDGWSVEAWLTKPAAYEAGRSCPLLLNVHGGPHAYYGWGFFDEFQVQTGAGYAVLSINPRGSQSYGEAFASACVGDWGGKDYQDVMSGLDFALDRFPFLDRERIGVLGGSYGGFMTSWIVGHTDRFRAAVSERAVNAQVSVFGTSDIGFYFQRYELGGPLQDQLAMYWERSPIAYAKQINTPLLIIHSENDLRCPMEQAEQLYVALKTLGRDDVVFVRFPEESHELSRSGKPSRRIERLQILLDWFDRFLHLERASEPRSRKLADALRSTG